MFKDKTILASKSPRRRELISLYFSSLSFYEGGLQEPDWNGSETPKRYLERCVGTKWANALEGVRLEQGPKHSGRWGLLVGDTTVVLDRRILGKPSNAREAQAMLRDLAGRTHRVWTGFRLGLFEGFKTLGDSQMVVVESRVRFYELTRREIDRYIREDRPFDKAGSYGFQDGALKFVAQVEGSYTNIVGLPIFEVAATARKLGFR